METVKMLCAIVIAVCSMMHCEMPHSRWTAHWSYRMARDIRVDLLNVSIVIILWCNIEWPLLLFLFKSVETLRVALLCRVGVEC